MERLQKVMAEAGVASRRKSEELIVNGHVKVNGELVTTLGVKVSPTDRISVDDVQINKEHKKYYCLYKPRYIISTAKDEHQRLSVIDILPKEIKEERLYPVGRLDYDTKGVLLITNDGTFSNKMVGPKSGIEKEYLVRLNGNVQNSDLIPLNTGLKLKDRVLLPAITKIESWDNKNNSTLVRIIITEGIYHQVKEMFKAIGFEVKRMTRIRFGCITLDGLREGDCRILTTHEVKELLKLSATEKNLIEKNNFKYREY